jgi:dTDP-4-amino-4,6-dideoxygalactose transaminase
MVGTIGDVGCFSFFANKNLTTGEGGMVVTKDDELAERIRLRRSHGMTTLTWDRHKGHSFSYDVVARGYNYRLDEMRAALGLVQLAKVRSNNAKRQEIVRLYQENLKDLEFIQLPFLDAPAGAAYHLFPIVLPSGADRSRFMRAMAASGIQTSIHYPPIYRFSHYRSLWPPNYRYRLAVTDDLAEREVTLPLFPTMTEDQLRKVIAAVRAFVCNNSDQN